MKGNDVPWLSVLLLISIGCRTCEDMDIVFKSLSLLLGNGSLDSKPWSDFPGETRKKLKTVCRGIVAATKFTYQYRSEYSISPWMRRSAYSGTTTLCRGKSNQVYKTVAHHFVLVFLPRPCPHPPGWMRGTDSGASLDQAARRSKTSRRTRWPRGKERVASPMGKRGGVG